MKSKKGLIGLTIIVAVLVLGVGYAVVSTVTLTISGSATMAPVELNVGFNGTVSGDVTNATTGATATGSNSGTSSTGVKTATLTVTNLAAVNDYVTVTYTVQNYETDVDANVYVSNIANDKSSFFEVTTDSTGSANKKAVTKNNGTNTITVKVKLIARPTTAADNEATITITLTGEPATS